MQPNFSAVPTATRAPATGTRFASRRAIRRLASVGTRGAAVGSLLAVLSMPLSMLGACGGPNLPRTTPDTEQAPTVVEFLPVPPVQPGSPRTLLQEMADRPPKSEEAWDAEQREWVLPYKTKRLDVVLIIGVASGNADLLARVLAPHAEWGMPDRRMLGARPIYGEDGGKRFFDALHHAAMRFPENATWKSQATLDGITQLYQTGAEPMWTYYEREGAGDWIVLRKTIFQGRPVIDYVGLWPDEPPSEPTPISAEIGPPPPLAPPVDRSMMPAMPGLPPQ